MGKVEHVNVSAALHDGSVAASFSGKEAHVFGMLPGEEGIVEFRKHKGVYYGELKELIKASADRVEASELHYLSCSPWQIMAYPLQVALKSEMLHSLFPLEHSYPSCDFIPAGVFSRYRTKIEYSVVEDGGLLTLAFHQRGYRFRMLYLTKGCILASDKMNDGAERLVRELNRLGYKGGEVKTIIMRESKSTQKVIGTVYFATEDYRQINWGDVGVSGGLAIYSDRRSPASITSRILDTFGEQSIVQRVGEVNIEYPWDGFFQNNIPMFEKALRDIQDELDPDDVVLDLYSGSGAIGLCVAQGVREVTALEVHATSVEFAMRNAKNNGISNYHATALPSEKIPEELVTSESVVILDPPRAGLHPKLVALLLAKAPKKIVYLSCNPVTQARDVTLLSEKYSVSKIRGYDLYPYTPHQESLVILNLRIPPDILPA